jgi:hypothetical protein
MGFALQVNIGRKFSHIAHALHVDEIKSSPWFLLLIAVSLDDFLDGRMIPAFGRSGLHPLAIEPMRNG